MIRRLAPLVAAGLLAVAPAAAQDAPQREALRIIASLSVPGVAAALAEEFAERHTGAPPPDIRRLDSGAALRAFCDGRGAETPDAVVVSRRMTRALATMCAENGVGAVVELRLGIGAAVLAVARGAPAPELTTRQVWLALAEEVPGEDGFVPNPARLWSDVASALPRAPIAVLVPPPGSGTRTLLEELVLEDGCRFVPAIRAIFDAAQRRAQCAALRPDQRIAVVPTDALPAVLLAAPAGTIGVLSYAQLLGSGGNLVPLALDGVLPDGATIGALDYGATRVLYLYAKREHAQHRGGVTVVRGLGEFLQAATAEPMVGPTGRLAALGIVPLSPAEREAERRAATALAAMRSR